MTGLKERTEEFGKTMGALPLEFDGFVYNPLDYALEAHLEYQELSGAGHAPTMMLGMNPGPYGMVQTGVPFGDVVTVRDFLQVCPVTRHPEKEHPSRPVEGFSCRRVEVSGQRIWGLLRSLYSTREELFSSFTVQNYCPLAFLDKGRTARNITPDKLSKHDRMLLMSSCDAYLKDLITILGIRTAVGVGAYAYERLLSCAPGYVRVIRMMHPSPASPEANRCFASATGELFAKEGLV